MKVIYSPRGIVGIDNPKRGISMVEKADLKSLVMDFSLGWNDYILENIGKCAVKRLGNMKNPEGLREMCGLLKSIYTECNSRNIQLPVAVAPYLNPNTKRYDLNDFLYKLIKECILICGEIGCKYLMVPSLFAGIPKDRIQKVNEEYYRKLANVSEEIGVVLLLKNQCRSINGHLVRGMFCNAEETMRFIDKINNAFENERIGFCLDTGICNICGQDMYDFVSILGNRLKTVILRDNDGYMDGSLLPFTSTGIGGTRTSWISLIRGLRRVNFNGDLIIDFHDSICAIPNMLRPQYLGFAKNIGAYFKWQLEQERILAKYTKRVLFGAGNMCRNYMKCYGEDYPPLFTCDNNSKLWDTEFEGIMVKNPEELKKIAKDCAIFICNIYYDEIETQLRDMGIKNPIEYFNDEYMTSFYFERLSKKRESVKTEF